MSDLGTVVSKVTRITTAWIQAANNLVWRYGAVSPLRYPGCVGDGTADESTYLTQAIATGRNVYLPRGYTFGTAGNITGFVNGQKIFGGGCVKKLGTVQQPIFLLPDGSDRVQFDGIEFDGNAALFSPANPVSGINGYITKSLKVTNCYFHDLPDAGIKLIDGARLYVSGSIFMNCQENGIELHNYPEDPRTALPYVGTRPVIEGCHTIIGNHFERSTRYENPAGPLVDACGVSFYGATGYPQKNVRIVGNNFIDCLRHVWTENNTTGSQADGVVIVGNTFSGGVNGGTAENIYGKAGVGLVSVAHAVVQGNTFRNVANTNPVGTETACVIVSGSSGVLVGSDIEISGNTFLDDSGLADRTEWGVYCLVGSNIRIHNNSFSGFATGNVYLDPTNVADAQSYANEGATSDQTWGQPVLLVFVRADVPAAGDQVTYPWGFTAETEVVLPTPGRLVGMAVKNSASISAGTATFKAFADGTENTALQITNADFTSTVATKRLSSSGVVQTAVAKRFKVVITTDGSFAPTTLDSVITLVVDVSYKR